ncbi:mechanosensitive ion channel family protein [Cohnella zeiphila]|uniref:Mechanosensitive ion channel family protein n=1 Tax=Cohnella zeiphila TaxID=2761120 RepID=A0A7X0SPY5_9BACL|nr:mechanosensitive ion channel family protein [Cohnella zeiphila]MBB6731718.1 mechanosensitive ion channel family protein [Cohnella zeiphila]
MGLNSLLNAPLAQLAADTAVGDSNEWTTFVHEIWDPLTSATLWIAVLKVMIRILLIFVVSRIARALILRMIDRMTNPRASRRFKLRTRRVQTVGKLLHNTASYVINFIVILLILGELNINLAPLIAGAGVIGLAIGFGAQNLVKDVISGFFIILEDHFSVGDVIETGKFKGTVEMIGLRATRLKSWTGEVFVIPNGSILDVTNFSVNNSLAVVDVSIAATERLETAVEIVRGVVNRFEDPSLVGAPELLGVQSLTASDIVLRITAQCKPNTQTALSRRLNAEIKKAFEEAGNPRYSNGTALERTGGA